MKQQGSSPPDLALKTRIEPANRIMSASFLARTTDRIAAFPAVAIAFVVRTLRRRKRRAAAEALLVRSLRLWPRSPLLLRHHAYGAHDEGRHEEAAERWRALLVLDPGSPFGLSGLAAKQRELERLDEADATIAEALALHPDHSLVLGEAARLADRRYDHPAALALWQRLHDRPGASSIFRQQRDWNLVMLGRLDEAEAEIAAARRLAPEHRGHLANAASLRMAQGQWQDAIELLRDFRTRYPDDIVGRELMGQALEGAAFAAAEASGKRRKPVDIERVEDDAIRSLLLGFESLGADCEFGLVQRRYGAEPLGLLRWNKVTFPNLLAGLGARFEGLGTREQTELGVFDLGEYRVRDTRYDLSMHTFVYRHQAEPGELIGKVSARLGYLRGKLVDDLATAEKVFVYKHAGLDDAAMRALHRALRVYGPVRLLCVTSAGEKAAGLLQTPVGTAVKLDEDLYVGIVARFGNASGAWNIAFPDWVAICSAVAADVHR